MSRNRKIGFLGKQIEIRPQGFKRVEALTEEERRQRILDNVNKSWNVDDKIEKMRVIAGKGPAGEVVPSPTPTPTITPTPSSTPPEQYNILTEGSDSIITEGSDNIVIEGAPDPTPTPTPTASVTPTFTPTPTQTPTQTGTPTPTPTPSATLTPTGYTEADAYLTAVVDAGGTGITPTYSAATRTFFNSLMTNSLWDKLIMFYPFMGGTAGAHKFNGKDPRDLDAAYRITWYGGVTHDSDGMVGNGTNGYGDTHFTVTSLLDYTEGSLGTYIQSTASTKSYSIEIGANFYNQQMNIRCGQNNGDLIGALYDEWNYPAFSSGATNGLNVLTRTSLTDVRWFTQGVERVQSSGENTDITQLTYDIYVGATNFGQSGGVAGDFSDRTQSFIFVGYGLTPTDVSNLNSAVQTLQTALGRNAY